MIYIRMINRTLIDVLSVAVYSTCLPGSLNKNMNNYNFKLKIITILTKRSQLLV